jgi:alpha-L-fucosidase
VRTLGEFIGSSPGGSYPAYAEAQMRELIERYAPSVLWNDICWPTDLDSMLQLMADYYESVPDGVVNDRWMHRGWALRMLGKRPVQRAVDALLSRKIRRDAAAGKASQGIVPPRPAHCDFRTPEYTSFDIITKHKWEATRGMSASFGYNRHQAEADYEPADELLRSFIDTVSKNGNLLLNVGPRGEDASIPEPQVARLESLGAWLAVNGAAIRGTRPFVHAEAEASDGTPVRFTRRDDTLYVILLRSPSEPRIFVPDLVVPKDARVRCLADEAWRGAHVADGGVHLTISENLPAAAAYAFSVELAT